ncbi:hypothetical protein AVEN_202657-1 [Araneus ventricosus]|uniref:Uncharacterized protein n=1 Tax=Araneus ventricosus TaxID=182803 RepID=A0A4Y2NKQ4_ARAVE|nr:hypothetical protein AVEN_59544-1 [Araneus ventricosus]GBN39423.1 hypothetical protein AVEN_202657-1 [Araneus ventricosus]
MKSRLTELIFHYITDHGLDYTGHVFNTRPNIISGGFLSTRPNRQFVIHFERTLQRVLDSLNDIKIGRNELRLGRFDDNAVSMQKEHIRRTWPPRWRTAISHSIYLDIDLYQWFNIRCQNKTPINETINSEEALISGYRHNVT